MKKEDQLEIFKTLISISVENKFKFFFIVLLITVLGVLELFSIILIYPIFANVANISEESDSIIIEKLYYFQEIIGIEFNLINTCFIFSLIISIKFVAEYFINKFLIKFVNQRISVIRKKLLSNYLALPWVDSLKITSGSLNSLIVTEIERLRGCILLLFKFTSTMIFALAFFLTAFFSNLKLFLLFFLLGFIKYLISFPLQKKTLKDGFLLSNSIDRISDELNETHSNLKLVKVHKVKSFFFKKLENAEDSIKDFSNSIAIMKQLLRSVDEFLIYLSGIIYLTISITVFQENIAEIVISGILLMRGVRKISEFQIFIQRMNSNHGLVSKISRKFNEWSEKNLKKKQIKNFNPINNIKFENVSIGFESKELIKNINLKLEFGKIYFMYGDSGIGKTCFLDSLVGLNEILKGKIFIDDKRVSTKKNELWFDDISYVTQDMALLNLSLRENILFGREFDNKKFRSAIEVSGLKNVEFQKKANKKLGEKGNQISGGQKQRVGIAREFYNLKKILILDEATTGIDQKSANMIFAKIKKVVTERKILTILVSHQKENINFCEEIIYFKNGRVFLKKK